MKRHRHGTTLTIVLATALVAAGACSSAADQVTTSVAPPPPTTSTAPAPTAPSTPAALIDRWVGPPRTIGALGTGTSAAFVEITDGFLMLETGNRDNPRAFGSNLSVVDDTTIELDLEGDVLDCLDGDLGTYTWSLSPQATTLTLTATNDACEARRTAIEGSWTHTACRLAGRDCLGPVEAGTYSTNRWNPYGSFTYGQATFTLPDGWAVTYDSQAALFIGLAEDYAANPDPKPYGLRAWADVAAAAQDPASCVESTTAPDPTAGAGAAAIADWMSKLPTMTTTRSTMMLGDLPAEVVDLDIKEGADTTCSWGTVLIVSRTSKPDPFGYGMVTSQHMRVILVDVLPDRTAAIFVDDEARPGFDALAAVAMPIVESFVFSPTPPTG